MVYSTKRQRGRWRSQKVCLNMNISSFRSDVRLLVQFSSYEYISEGNAKQQAKSLCNLFLGTLRQCMMNRWPILTVAGCTGWDISKHIFPHCTVQKWTNNLNINKQTFEVYKTVSNKKRREKLHACNFDKLFNNFDFL